MDKRKHTSHNFDGVSSLFFKKIPAEQFRRENLSQDAIRKIDPVFSCRWGYIFDPSND